MVYKNRYQYTHSLIIPQYSVRIQRRKKKPKCDGSLFKFFVEQESFEYFQAAKVSD